jgi:DNA repair protein RadA/Sms
MPPKSKTHYICQSCGAVHSKWLGRCDACGAWNTLVEEQATASETPQGRKLGRGTALAFSDLSGDALAAPRLPSGMSEFDRVCGGGIVPGSAILIGGDPGIGKSTILLQIAASVARQHRCAYITGEESIEQIRLRARRLGVVSAAVDLAASSTLTDIMASLESGARGYDLVIVDSIQTLYADSLESAPGTVAQVRFCAQELIRLAKSRNFCLVLVGHVTKEGTLAGPRVLEHMVDAVLYFEGDRGHQFRLLRTVKNRFGATNEIGVFAMTDTGLEEVTNPSALFLSERQGTVSGAAVFAGIEGTRPLLVEIQALVAPSPLGMPRRTVVGWDANRLAMLVAVLETRCGISFAGKDIYLNVAGGLRISEPAADLAVAAALVSALRDTALPRDLVLFGEVALSGEVRTVAQTPARLREAERLGFRRAIMPKTAGIQTTLDATTLGGVRALLPVFG